MMEGAIFIAAVMLDRNMKMTHGIKLGQTSSQNPASALPSGIQVQLLNFYKYIETKYVLFPVIFTPGNRISFLIFIPKVIFIIVALIL